MTPSDLRPPDYNRPVGWRIEGPRWRLPRIEWPGRRHPHEGSAVIRERTFALKESPVKPEAKPDPNRRPPRRSWIDFRGIWILVTAREFLDRLVGITGEMLVSAGVFVLLFLGWHVWFNDIVQGAAQDRASQALSGQWGSGSAGTPEFDKAMGNSAGVALDRTPPVAAAPASGESFATMIVPRFGKHYVRTIAETTDSAEVLNDESTGVGHYEATNQLGAIGNFAVAGHRTTYGAPFGNIDQLRVGDRIYIETPLGWYVYRFRNLEYVYPTQVTVLDPVPDDTVTARDRLLTMTSCHPKLSAAERIIAYSVFESFVPRANGAPAEVAAATTKS